MKNSFHTGNDVETLTFHKGKRAWYCVYANGIVTRTWLKSLREEKIPIYFHRRDKKAYFGADGKQYVLKHVVAKAFLPGYEKGTSVIVRDGNELNCSVENLKILSKREFSKYKSDYSKTSVRIKVISPSGTQTVYLSIRSAAEQLFCSCRTLQRYLKGKTQRSVLSDYRISRQGN